MCIDVTSRAWKHSQATGASLLVILALSDRADEDGYCWPGVDFLAHRARVTPRQVQRILPQLENLGELYVEHRTGRKHTNNYFVVVGLDQPAIVRVLMRRFGLTLIEATAAAIRLLEAQNKGELEVTISTPVTPENGDSQDANGDIGAGNGDIQGQEKVTPMSPDPSLDSPDSDSSGDPRARAGAAEPEQAAECAFIEQFLQAFGLEKFHTAGQLAAVLGFREEFGAETTLACARWAAGKPGMTLAKAIRSLRTALPAWGSGAPALPAPDRPPNGAKGPAARPAEDPLSAALRRRLEQLNGHSR
jgi:hypothetical protein